MSLELEAMPNNLVNYGVTENGIAIIELCSDSDGKPLSEGKTPVNTYTREMWEDIDRAILNARFDDKVTVILLTGKGNNLNFALLLSIFFIKTGSSFSISLKIGSIILWVKPCSY